MLSKSRLMAYLQCPRRLWLEVYRPKEKKQDQNVLGTLFLWGNLLNNIARTQHPKYKGGILIKHPDSPKNALADTVKILSQNNFSVFYEPAFAIQNIFVRIDVLKRNGNSFEMFEIKSSTSVKDYHLEDCAIQAWVLKKCGLPISRIALIYINRDFVYNGDNNYQELFIEKDITEEVKNIIPQIPSWIEEALKIIKDNNSEPSISPGPHCKKPYICPFGEYCDRKAGVKFPVWHLPYVSSKGFLDFLLQNKIFEVSAISEEMISLMDKRTYAIWEGIHRGHEFIYPSLANFLQNLSYPRFYFDFETVSFAVPVWKGTRPYQNIPFQWSCHIEKASGEVEHHEYIDLSGKDPRPGIINSLIKLFERTEGPIIVYSNYEKRIFQELSREFPTYKNFFENLISRIVDFHRLISQGYRHPGLRSFSLKDVAPVVIPNFSYKDLDIAEGDMATNTYLKLFYDNATEEEISHYKQALLSYCKRDTQALYLLARELEKKIKKEGTYGYAANF